MNARWLSALAVMGLLVGGCASDKYLASEGHALFDRRQWAQAAAAFDKDAQKPGTNQVLFLMDEGSALFENRQYKEAIDVLLKAEKLAEIKDYTSVSEEVGTLVTSDNVRGYKGEDFEKILINVYLGLAYAAQGNIEDAQVEARKINDLLYRMIHEGKRNYQESPFARYFSAVLWEANGSYNDAYIDYKKTYELDPDFPEIGRDLIAMSKRMGFKDEEQEWRKKFPDATPRSIYGKWPGRGTPPEGEIVVIFERGLGPVKIPRGGRNDNSSLPRYVSRWSDVAGARVKINGVETTKPVTVLNVDDLSKRYLEDRIGRMAAAKLGGMAVKGALAYGIGKLAKSEDAGLLAFVALMASDHADLRSWRSLPAELQMARIPVKPGTYDVSLESLGHGGGAMADKDFPKVEIKAGHKAFLVGR